LALTRVIWLESADGTGFEKAHEHLQETASIEVSARQSNQRPRGAVRCPSLTGTPNAAAESRA
jgi:hypothetical protein